MTIVINLFGGPGSGKTTIGHGLFYQLKKQEINCEFVQEYVKKWAWQGILPNKLDQFYISGKQTKAEQMLYGKVDYIVTDCPLLMGPFYDKKYNNSTMVEQAVDTFMGMTDPEVTRLNFVVKRAKKYIQAGRYSSEESSKQIDLELLVYLKNKGITFDRLTGDLDEQVQQILVKLNR